MNNAKTMKHTLYITSDNGSEVCRFTVSGKMIEDGGMYLLDITKNEAYALTLQFAYWNLNNVSGGNKNYGSCQFRKDGIAVGIRCAGFGHDSYIADNAYFLCEFVRNRDNRSFNFTNTNANK